MIQIQLKGRKVGLESENESYKDDLRVVNNTIATLEYPLFYRHYRSREVPVVVVIRYNVRLPLRFSLLVSRFVILMVLMSVSKLPNMELKVACASMLELHKRAFKAQLRCHQEVCGVVLLNDSGFMEFEYIVNKSGKSGSYVIHIDDIKIISDSLKRSKWEVLGSFHSHPVSEPMPGINDIKYAFYNNIEFIYDVCGRHGKLWQLKNGSPIELKFEIVPNW